MKEFILEGTVDDIRELRSGQRADGTNWTQQTYALRIDTGGGYNALVAFDLFGERIRQADIKQGERIAVWVNPHSELYQGRYYTHLRAYHVSRHTAAQPIANNAAPANATTAPANAATMPANAATALSPTTVLPGMDVPPVRDREDDLPF